MSKKTFIICDQCQKMMGGIGYSTLWAKLSHMGWLSDKGKVHLCPECRAIWERKNAWQENEQPKTA